MSEWIKSIQDNFKLYSYLPQGVALFIIKGEDIEFSKSNNEFNQLFELTPPLILPDTVKLSIYEAYLEFKKKKENNSFSIHYKDKVISFLINNISDEAFLVVSCEIKNFYPDGDKLNGDFFKLLIESLDDPVFVKDEDHRWVYMNDALVKQIDIPKEVLIGRTDHDVFPKHQADVFWEKDDEVFKSGITNVNEEEITFQGNKRTIITKKLLWVDPETGKRYITGTIRDVTKHKKNEAILLESKRQFEMAVQAGNIGIWNYDINSGDLYVDPIVKSFIGYGELDEIESLKDWFGLIHPADKPKMSDLFDNIRQVNKYVENYRLIHKNGNSVWLLLHGRLILDENGNPQRFMGTVANITRQKEAELALIENENKLGTILNTLPEAVIEVDLDGTITFVNQMTCLFTGKTREELIGSNFMDIDYPAVQTNNEKLDISNGPVRRALAKGEMTTGFEFGITMNGKKYWMVTNVIPLKKNDKVYGAVATYKDISHRKDVENQLKQREEKYRNIFYNIQNVYYEHDIKGEIYELSPSVKVISGYTREELIGRNMIEFPRNKAVYEEYINQLREKGYINGFEIELVSKDGNNKICILNSMVVGKGKSSKIVGSLSDITLRIKAERTLKRAHQQLRAVFDTIPGMIYVIDSNYKILEVSSNIIKKYKLKNNSEATGQLCYSLLYNRNKPCSGCVVERVFNVGVVTSSDFRPDYFSKSDKTYKIYSAPIKDDVNNVWAAAQLLIDVTDLSKTQSELKNMIVALKISNKLTEEKAAEIQKLNNRLQESEKELKILNASKDKFFSIVAHDLKSPFQGFLSLSRMLLKDIDILKGDDLKELAKDLNDSANGIFKLLENLLQWSRIQRGSIDYHPSKYGLRAVVESNLEILSSNAKAKYIDLNNHVTSGLSVNADINMLNTIIRNLVSNAIKFSNYDSKVEIFAEPVDNSLVALEIRDYGVGIEEDSIRKLFRIDEHLTTIGTANEKGTGLGLILCKELAEKNGGSIRVESQPGKGSSFIVTIPLANSTGS